MPNKSTDERDKALMLRVQNGDTEAFAELDNLHRETLLRCCLRWTSNQHTAEDLTQETLLRVFDRRETYKPGQPFRGWLYQIARNLLRDHYRSRKVDALGHQGGPVEGLRTTDSKQAEPIVAAMVNETSEHVRMHIKALKPKHRKVLLRHCLRHERLLDIAAATGVPAATARNRLMVGKAALKRRLTESGAVDGIL